MYTVQVYWRALSTVLPSYDYGQLAANQHYPQVAA